MDRILLLPGTVIPRELILFNLTMGGAEDGLGSAKWEKFYQAFTHPCARLADRRLVSLILAGREPETRPTAYALRASDLKKEGWEGKNEMPAERHQRSRAAVTSTRSSQNATMCLQILARAIEDTFKNN